jgi:lipoprotein signal peptidase
VATTAAPRPSATPEADGRREWRTLATVALLLTVADLVTKQIAVARLGSGLDLDLGPALRLTLLYNDALAWGLSGGGWAFALTAAGTVLLLAAIALVLRPLAAVDTSAPRMLGLVVGAAVGNLASLLVWPAGAPDFVAVDGGAGTEWVFNVADFGLFVGLALCCRTTWRIALAARAELAARPGTTAVASLEVGTHAPVSGERRLPRRPVEREIPLVVARDRATERDVTSSPERAAPRRLLPPRRSDEQPRTGQRVRRAFEPVVELATTGTPGGALRRTR